jgi:hypothetical protein
MGNMIVAQNMPAITNYWNVLKKHPGQAAVYIIIDALDEFPATTSMPSPCGKVLGLVQEELVSSHTPNLRVCVTRRPEADIASVLDLLAFRSVS